MKNVFSLAALCIFFVCSNSVSAQDADMMKKWQEAMTPGEMHKVLASVEGDWTTDGKMWMDPKAQPATSTGTANYKMILGGRYQESTFKGDMMGMPFEGVGVMGYDNVKKQFESTWFDNMGTGTMRAEGQFDAATKTFTLKGKFIDPMSGKECSVRETLQMVDNNKHIMTMYSSIGGAPEYKTMELTFNRKK